MRLRWIAVSVLGGLIGLALALAAPAPAAPAPAAEPAVPIKAGIIGMDAHALPWTKIINNPQATGELADMTVVAAFPGGSPDIPQSMEILGNSVEPVRGMGVEIVDSIDALLEKVDAVLLLSIDGRTHLEQVKPVFAAGKPVFIDKPIAGSLAEAIEIFRLAAEHKVPCFSSSSLRFAPGTIGVRSNPALGEVRGCDQYSPCALEPHHPDLFWYGIHGVEPLFTIMGTGCQSVTRVHTEGTDVTVGTWADGRLGSVRGIRDGQRGYGATVFGSKGIVQSGKFEGYEPLIEEIVRFFKTGKPPVSAEETLDIFAFMEAADESKRQGGCPVTLESVLAEARKGPVVYREVVMGADGELTLDGVAVTLEDLPGKLKAAATESPNRQVLIRGAPTVPTGRIQEVIKACQAGGIERFSLRAEKPEPPQE